jgi:hypothetical protein
MNWGKGIALVLIIFVLGLAFLVYKTTEVESEMVTENYYEKELSYEKIIEGKRNINLLKEDVKIEVQTNEIAIIFPKELEASKIVGNILFYRPSDTKKDRTVPIQLANNVQLVDIKNFTTGNYQVQITFSEGEKEYYFEKNIFVP